MQLSEEFLELVSVLKEQEEIYIYFFSSTKQAKNLKTF
jgi:hypothetical protein